MYFYVRKSEVGHFKKKKEKKKETHMFSELILLKCLKDLAFYINHALSSF